MVTQSTGSNLCREKQLQCPGESMCRFNGTSHICVCPDNKPPNGDNGNCDNHRGEVGANHTSNGVISSAELLSMTNSNNKHDNDAKIINGDLYSISPVALATILVGVACVGVLIAALYVCRRRVWSSRGSRGSCSSLTKHQLPISQPRYAANPNYYSSGEDPTLLTMLKNLEINRERLSFSHEIGEGCFGKVYKGELCHSDVVIPVAVKVLKENASAEAEEDFHREVEIMSTFEHDNILQLLGVVIKDTGAMPWMIFEYMEFGDLADLLRKNSTHLTPNNQSPTCKLDGDRLLSIAFQVASGMLYLSQHHFVHRDLATRNCLVGRGLQVKISDFGMSRDIYTCDYYKIGGSRLLPVRWMAPESIMYGKFTLESDVWSFGVLLWEVFSFGKQPYYGHSNEEVVKLILQGILLLPPLDCPTTVCELMTGCWRTNPLHRLNFQEIHGRLSTQTQLSQVNANNNNNGNRNNRKQSLGKIDVDNYLIPNRTPLISVV